ncbi:hypothetical protein TWF281_008773 [Arthrobotrys megalospora]
MGDNPDFYPAPRYRKFLRKVQLEIIDFRVMRMKGDELWGEKGERFLAAGRTTLLPFMGKLKRMLGPAGRDVTLDILANRYLRCQTDFRRDRPKLRWLQNSEVKADDPIDEALELMGDVLLLETIWPLTTGGWECRIDAGSDDEEFKLWAGGVLESCNRHSQFKRKRMLEFEGAPVAGDCYFALVRRRVKLVRNGLRYSCCYGCDRRELEEARGNVDAVGEPAHRSRGK